MTETTRSTPQRLRDLEAYAIRHGELIQELVTDVEALKKVQRDQELKDIREEGRWATLVAQLESFDKRLGKIEGLGNKALGVFIIAIIGAFAAFIIRGGLV
jgi:hypothetical protein